MDEKKLKLGWTVSETIGVAIVNPRASHSARALPQITLTYKGATLIITDNAITITGTIEEAAMALADHILKDVKRMDAIGAKYFSYRSMEVYLIDGNVVLNPKVLNIMEPGDWDFLKKSTEKICNNLKVFM